MINQDDFNKIITGALLLFCMIMFGLSWYTGKSIDIQGFLILLAPIFTHLGHIVTDNSYQLATLKKDTAIATTNGALSSNTAAVIANTAAQKSGALPSGS